MRVQEGMNLCRVLMILHVIDRIGLDRADDLPSDDFIVGHEVQLVDEIADTTLRDRVVVQFPNLVASGAEALEDQRRMLLVGHHRLAPVLRLMHAAE